MQKRLPSKLFSGFIEHLFFSLEATKVGEAWSPVDIFMSFRKFTASYISSTHDVTFIDGFQATYEMARLVDRTCSLVLTAHSGTLESPHGSVVE